MTPALGPGDDDPKSPAVVVPSAAPALGPGDDDPRSPAAGVPTASRGPLAPGESDGTNDDDAFHFLTPAPAGPGGTDSGPRQLVRIPKRG